MTLPRSPTALVNPAVVLEQQAIDVMLLWATRSVLRSRLVLGLPSVTAITMLSSEGLRWQTLVQVRGSTQRQRKTQPLATVVMATPPNILPLPPMSTALLMLMFNLPVSPLATMVFELGSVTGRRLLWACSRMKLGNWVRLSGDISAVEMLLLVLPTMVPSRVAVSAVVMVGLVPSALSSPAWLRLVMFVLTWMLRLRWKTSLHRRLMTWLTELPRFSFVMSSVV